MRVYDTCHPEKAPTELKVSASIADGITKLCWSTTEQNVVIIGKKSGVVEKWDTRSSELKPIMSASVPGGDTVMDFEVSDKHGLVMVASGKKVCAAHSVLFLIHRTHCYCADCDCVCAATASGLFVRCSLLRHAHGARHALAHDLQGGGRRLAQPRWSQVHCGEFQ